MSGVDKKSATEIFWFFFAKLKSLVGESKLHEHEEPRDSHSCSPSWQKDQTNSVPLDQSQRKFHRHGYLDWKLDICVNGVPWECTLLTSWNSHETLLFFLGDIE
jgi:hypothetical protein